MEKDRVALLLGERAYGVGFVLSTTNSHWMKIMSYLPHPSTFLKFPCIEWGIACLVSNKPWEMLCCLKICHASFII